MATEITNANLATKLAASAEANGDLIALKLDDVELTFAALSGSAALVAGLLKSKGIEAGDRVAVMLPNVPHFPVIYYAALNLGAIVVPMNPLLSKREVAYYLQDSGAKIILAWHGFAEAAEAGAAETGVEAIIVEPAEFAQLVGAQTPFTEIVERSGEDTAILLYTSGTTGQPKGAELTHNNIVKNVDASKGLFDPSPGDVFFGGLPFFHAFGQICCMNAAIANGATITILPRFEPTKALEIIQRDKVTVFMGVPTMYAALLNDPTRESTDVSSLRLAASGGASLPVEILRGFEKAFGCDLLEGYGLSETSPVASFNQLTVGRKAGSIGTPIPGVEMRVVGEDGNEVPQGERGEIQIRGHNIMRGYWKKPEATAEAIDSEGWFKSGDIGYVDEEGFYFVVDRKKDLIIRGGYNVYPREIEEVLYEHPAVAEAAVIGIADESLGEEVAAAVALKPGTEATPEELKAFVKEQVAAYKYPRHLWLVEALPKGATGKILKREIQVPQEFS